MSTLEQRFRQIMSEKKLRLAPLARECGLDRQTLYAAFKREKQTGDHSLDHATAVRIAKCSGKTVPWVLGHENGAASAPAPALVVDTLALAEEAARDLARDEGLSVEQAWSVMRGVRVAAPSVYEFYRVAQKKLRGRGSHLVRTPEMPEGARARMRRSSRPPEGSGAVSRRGKKPSRS